MDKIDSQEIAEEIYKLFDLGKLVKNRYEYNLEMIREKELEQNDLLHFIENKNYSGPQMIKVYQELKKCRVERRIMKDENEELQYLYKAIEHFNFFSNKEFNKLKSLLGQAMNDIPQTREKLERRNYYPRIRTDLEEGIEVKETSLIEKAKRILENKNSA